MPKKAQGIGIFLVVLSLVGGGLLLFTPKNEVETVSDVVVEEDTEEIAPKQIYELKPEAPPLTNPFTMAHGKAQDNQGDAPEAAKELASKGQQDQTGQRGKMVATPPSNVVKPSPGPKAAGAIKYMDLQLTGIIIFNHKAVALVNVNKESRRVVVGDTLPQGTVVAINKGSMTVATPAGAKVYRIN